MTLPKVISRYLLMIAAMMSVPPVLPLAQKATPIPPPQNDAPMTHAKGWSLRRGDAGGQLLDNGKEESQGKYSKMVLIQNFNPNSLRASNNKKKLMLKYVYCTGNPLPNIQ